MKKFIGKLILFLLIVLTPLLTLNYLYKNTTAYDAANEMYYLKHFPKAIELLNLGNSHEKAGIFWEGNYLGVAHNFATPSQPFYYDYYVLINASESIKKGAVVIIPISYFDWYYDYRNLFTEIPSYNARYYSLLPANQLLNYDFETDVKQNWLPILTAKQNIKCIFNDIQVPAQYNVGNVCVKKSEINEIAKYKAGDWKENVMEYNEETKRDNINYFRKIIDYCYKKEFVPVVVSLPVTNQLTQEMGKSFMQEFEQCNREAMEGYENLLFLDYSRYKPITADLAYFRDSDHMTMDGANEFTKKLLTDLEKNAIIDSEQLKE